jgi:hypothetical protein
MMAAHHAGIRSAVTADVPGMRFLDFTLRFTDVLKRILREPRQK